MMMYPGIMQFKMTNGEEIICQVLEYPEEDDTDYVVKDALSMITRTVGTSHTKYMFKPWFTMAEREDQYISIAKDHIVACVSPNTTLYSEYRKARREMHLNSRARPQTEEQIIADSKVRDFSPLYKTLYDRVDEYANGKVGQTILNIADGQYKDPMVVDKEINVMAMMINIIMTIK